MEISEAFQKSYLDFQNWPQTVIHDRPYPARVATYQLRLHADTRRLLQSSKIWVRFRDMNPGAKVFEPRIVNSDEDLRRHLGDNAVVSVGKQGPQLTSGQIATRGDPLCRFVYISAPSSRASLWLDKVALTRILTFHQVMPEYFDFLSLLGDQIEMADSILSGFQDNTRLTFNPQTPQSPSLGRSGKCIEMCYSLRTVAKKDDSCPRDDSHENWSIQPAAIYHRYDVEYGTAFWLVAHGYDELYQDIRKHTRDNGRPQDLDFSTRPSSFRATLGVHCLFAYWAVKQWDAYTRYLETHAHNTTDNLVYEKRERSPQRTRVDHQLIETRDIQFQEELCRQAVVAIDGNISVLEDLATRYDQLSSDTNFVLQNDCQTNLNTFSAEVRRSVARLKTELRRVQCVESLLAGRKALVYQYIQAQTAERSESLNLSTRAIAVESQHEASTVRIFTVVTLFFLPITFVSTAFSANIFSFADGQASTTPSFYSEGFGVWAGLSIALTLLTLGVARWYYLRSHDILEEKRGHDTFYVLKDGKLTDEEMAMGDTQGHSKPLTRTRSFARFFGIVSVLDRWSVKTTNDDLPVKKQEKSRHRGQSDMGLPQFQPRPLEKAP